MTQNNTDDLRQVLERNRTALNTRDLEGYLNNQASDVTLTSPGGVVLHGRDQAKQYTEAFWTAFPDVALTFGEQVFEGDKAVTEVTVTGTHTGPMATPNGPLPPTGKSITIHSISLLHIKDGLVASEHVYFDQLDLMTQLGLMPKAGAPQG